MRNGRFEPVILGTGSACGKAILVGEHFVVWGGTALAVPLTGARCDVKLSIAPAPRTEILFPEFPADERMRKAARLAARAFLGRRARRIEIELASNLPAGAGLGASAAFSVALLRAFSVALETGDEDVIAQKALDLERIFHGHPSGIDSTTIAYEAPCYVKTGDRFVGRARGAKGPLAGFIDLAPGGLFLLADSGERHDTAVAVSAVGRMAETAAGRRTIEKLTQVSETIALQTATALRQGDWPYVGSMMTENHYLLAALGVSTERLETLRRAAVGAGALGAKLTGAGAGGFLLALTTPSGAARIRRALCAAGTPRIIEQTTG
jgi:mevalonate kinase